MKCNKCQIVPSDIIGEDPRFYCGSSEHTDVHGDDCIYGNHNTNHVSICIWYYSDGIDAFCENNQAKVDSARTYAVVVKKWLAKYDKGNDL